MAIAAFKTRIFSQIADLLSFIQTGGVTVVVKVVNDNSGAFVLFYT
jgi:hypothetical protein